MLMKFKLFEKVDMKSGIAYINRQNNPRSVNIIKISTTKGLIISCVILAGFALNPIYRPKAITISENLNIKGVLNAKFETPIEKDVTIITESIDSQMESLKDEMELIKIRAQEEDTVKQAEEQKRLLEEQNKQIKEANRRKYIESFGGNPDFLGTIAERALQEAMTQIGKPYVWGATGPNSYDCSGLLTWAYERQGKTDLPRTTKGQWNKGEKIRREDIKPGDLIYFLNNKNNGPVDHVGIYIGDNKMLHAPAPGKNVEIRNVYWSRFVVIRRHVG